MDEGKHTPRPRPVHKAVLPVFAAAIVILTAWAYLREDGTSGAGGTSDVPFLARADAGATAPPFRATALSGRAIDFPGDYRGKVVLVDFWATWCGPCVREFPHLLEAHKQFSGRGFEIIGISLDAPNGIPAQTVQNFLNQRKVPWEVVYHNTGPIAGDYRVAGIPAPFLVDGDTGAILASDPQTRGPTLLKTIERVLASRSDG